MRNLPDSHVASFSTDEVSQLDNNHASWLVSYHGTHMTVEQLEATPGSSIQNLDVANLPAEVFDELSIAKVNQLSATQMRNLPDSHVASFSTDEVSRLDNNHASWLASYHLTRLNGDQLSAFGSNVLRSVDVTRLSAETVGELAGPAVARLSDQQLHALSLEQVEALVTEDLDLTRLTALQRSWLSLDQIESASGASTWTVGGDSNDLMLGGVDVDLLAGGLGDDQLVGGAGSDLLLGGSGNDRLLGGGGADLLSGGEGQDIADYSDSREGVDIDLNRAEQRGGDAEGDRLRDVEDVAGSAGDDVLVGNAGANRLEGGSGDDRLTGGAGHDTLIGGAGNDVVEGGVGNDLLVGGAGDDQYDGGEGFDVVSYRDLDEPLVIDPTTGMVLKSDGVDRLTEVERIEGSQAGNTFSFAHPTAGASYRVAGGAAEDVLDLSRFARRDLTVTSGLIEVRLADGSTFQIEHESIDRVLLSDGELANVSLSDQSLTTSAGTAIRTESVLASAFDLDGDGLRVDSFTQPAHGHVTLHPDGSFTYVPNDGEFGADAFQVKVVDEDGNESVATIRVEVTAPGQRLATERELPQVKPLEQVVSSRHAEGEPAPVDTTADDERNEFAERLNTLATRFDLDLLDALGDLEHTNGVPGEEGRGELGITGIAELEALLEQLGEEDLETLRATFGEELEKFLSSDAPTDPAEEVDASLELTGVSPGPRDQSAELQLLFGALGGMLMGMVGMKRDKPTEEEKGRQPREVRSGL
ncbi:MAG: cadherin-like domain-containing protein, partial [Planctomycetales bacterium]|nr:cadherin-like domain-containing protein [Planctomycetales bacterium]